jgi:hypothetical protein
MRSPSVVKEEIDKLEKPLVGAADGESGVVGQLPESQFEERRHGHPALAIQPFLPVAIYFRLFFQTFLYTL